MRVYTVHEQPFPSADRIDRAVDLVFVKEGFSFSAAALAPIWLLVHRMWLPFLGYVAILAVLEAIAWALGIPAGLSSLVAIGLHAAIGLEADTLRRWGLESKGWTEIGAVTGRSQLDCERRFLESWLPLQPMVAMPGNGHRMLPPSAPEDDRREAPTVPPKPPIAANRGSVRPSNPLARFLRRSRDV